MINPEHIYQKLVGLGEDWADANAAAELLEETKKVLLAQLMLASEASSMAAKESYALSDPSYKIHINRMVEARKEANKAKVRYISAQAWFEAKRTESANERAANKAAV